MAYNPPELSVPDIISALRELCGCHLQESNFSKPDSIEWQSVFTKLICEVTDSTEDCIKQPPLNMELEYPELYTDAIPLMNLIRAMQKIMPSLFVEDFTSRDIIFPTVGRLRKVCSAIINFLRFKQMRIDVYYSVKEDVETEREHYDTVLKRNEELKMKINKIRSDRAQQEPEIAKVQEKINQASMTMQEHHKTKQSIQKNISDLKTKAAEKKARVDQLKCELLRGKETEEKLDQKIVQSPAKVRAEQDCLKHKVEEMNETMERKRHRLGELQNQRKEAKMTVDHCEKGLQLLELIQASVDKEAEIASQMNEIFDKIHEDQEQVRELSMREQQLKEMLTNRQEKIAKLTLMHQNKVKVIKEQNEAYKDSKENLEKKECCHNEMQGQVMEYRKKVEEDVRSMKETVDHKIQAMTEMYSRMIENTDKFNNVIASKWNEIRQLLNQ